MPGNAACVLLTLEPGWGKIHLGLQTTQRVCPNTCIGTTFSAVPIPPMLSTEMKGKYKTTLSEQSLLVHYPPRQWAGGGVPHPRAYAQRCWHAHMWCQRALPQTTNQRAAAPARETGRRRGRVCGTTPQVGHWRA
eukprot:888325-Pelagomonas_calceolata.AAC.4